MGALVPEYEVQASTVSKNPRTGLITIGLQTDQGPVALYLTAEILFLLRVGIEKMDVGEDDDRET